MGEVIAARSVLRVDATDEGGRIVVAISGVSDDARKRVADQYELACQRIELTQPHLVQQLRIGGEPHVLRLHRGSTITCDSFEGLSDQGLTAAAHHTKVTRQRHHS